MSGPDPDATCDVLVVGSGAGGMAAAVTAGLLGLEVMVVEKAPVFGGTTAWSGGWLWIPCNTHVRRAGKADSLEAARSYLEAEIGPGFDPDKADAYLRHGPAMVDFLERHECMRFQPGLGVPDFHHDSPGASVGRLVGAVPLHGDELGNLLGTLRAPMREMTIAGMAVASGQDMQLLAAAGRSPAAFLYATRRFCRYWLHRLRYGRDAWLVNGNALAARLGRSLQTLGISLQLSTRAVELRRHDGAVTGVRLRSPSGEREVIARRGVILATGGFGQDSELRDRYFPPSGNAHGHLSIVTEGSTGDGLRLARELGGSIREGLAAAGGLIPVSLIPRGDGTTGRFPHFTDRAKPGVIAVTAAGRRFVNEAEPYHDFVQALYRSADSAGEVAAYLICDHRCLRRYGLGYVKPRPVPIRHHLASGYLKRGWTLEELATATGIDRDGLRQTADAYNAGARRGEDPAYHRGSTPYNRALGDPECRPNPCVAPLEQPPYYAVKVYPGSLSTFIGLHTDRHARVLDGENAPIPGLYAVGNDMASLGAGVYPSGGVTLGSAMTFAYLAAHHLAGREPAALEPGG